MDGETSEYWSASNLMRQFTDSYIVPEYGGLQRTDMAITTCRLPTLPWSIVIFIGSRYT
jgi:hypothetical protein